MGVKARRMYLAGGGRRHGLSRREWFACAALSCAAACGAPRVPAQDGAQWGRSGTRDGEFHRPRAISATNEEVFVIDTSGRMQVFTHEGAFLRGWLMPEYENGTPTGITFAPTGSLLIPDTHYSRVLEYTPQGELLSQWGEYGADETRFIYPTDLVLAPDGTCYFSEYGGGAERVHVFDAQHRFVRQWGSHGDQPGQFSRAMAIALHEDTVLVCDTANHRIQSFKTTGEPLRVIGGPGSGTGQLKYPHDIVLAPGDTFIVSEYGNNRLSRFTIDGEFMACFGAPGRGPGQFSAPRGVALSPNGRLFVADTDNDRIQRFGIEVLA